MSRCRSKNTTQMKLQALSELFTKVIYIIVVALSHCSCTSIDILRFRVTCIINQKLSVYEKKFSNN